MSRRLPLFLCATSAVIISACGAAASDESGETLVPSTPVPTIGGVGVLPDTVPRTRQAVMLVPPPVNDDGTAAELIGERVDGNRILLIGDSILASTSSRYGGQMCDVLVPLGWKAAVEAEPSRFIDFGPRVLDRVLDDEPAPDDDWDAAVVFLGSNYGGDEVAYEVELRETLDRLAPRPTLLFTVSEYRSDYAEVNDVVRRLGAEYESVTIIDWQAISESPGVLSSDRLHPTETGREVLAEAIAVALGPVEGEGECLRSEFRNDSAANSSNGGGSSVGRTSGSGSTGNSRGSNSSGGSGGSQAPATTAPSGGGGEGDGGTPTGPTVPAGGDQGGGDGGGGDGSGDGGGDSGGGDGGGSGGADPGSGGGESSGGGSGGGGAGGSGGTGGSSGGGAGGGGDGLTDSTGSTP